MSSKKIGRRPRLLWMLAAAASTCAMPALASDQAPDARMRITSELASPALDEVVVTAQRREEGLQDTPIAVTALSAADLRAQNVTALSDIAPHVPGLSISTASTTAPSAALPVVYIRGIGQQDPSIFADPGVGIYVDGVYVARSAGATIDLPDITRVEVLRGPQGTLFGKNAVGGAVNIVTQMPSDEFTGSLVASAGNLDRVEIRTLLSGPLADTLGATLAASYRDIDGYGTRLSFPDRSKSGMQGAEQHVAGRARLQWQPTSNFTLDLAGDYTRYRDTPPAGESTVYPPTAVYSLWNSAVGIPSGTPWTAANTDTGERYASFATGPNFANSDIKGVSASVDWQLGAQTLRSISAFRSTDETYSRDSDGSPANFFAATGFHDMEQYSQELQLLGTAVDERLDWLTGVYYLRETGDQQDLAIIAPGLYTVTGNTALELGRLYSAGIETDSYAGFGQATYALDPRWSLTAGLRYTREEKASVISALGTESGILYVPPTELGKSWNALTPKLGVQVRASDDLMMYASAAKGFKSGGFNGRAGRPAALTIFDPENVWSYELGLKSTALERRLRLNVSAYFMSYKDIQLARFALTPQGVLNTTENVAAAEVWGLEVEALARPVRGLQFSLAAGYSDNRYTEIEPGATVVKGNKIPFAPKWSGTASGEYVISLPGGAAITPRVDVKYKSNVYAVLNNTPPSDLSGYTLLNARVTYEPESAFWSVSAFGTNLTDRYYYVAAQDNTTASLLYRMLGRPREYGVSFEVRF